VSHPVQTADPSSATQAATRRWRILVTVIVLALVAFGFFVTTFFKPWQ
jgi:hypothetical protein